MSLYPDFSVKFIAKIQAAVSELDLPLIGRVAEQLYQAKEEGRRIFVFGNGGSLSIATHLACDLGKGVKRMGGGKNRKHYRIQALDNSAWLSAQANDGAEPFQTGDHPGIYNHGYDGVFVGQMENFAEPGDIALGISSSGNSPNVVNALKFAKDRGLQTIAMVGFDGGVAAKVAETVLLVPSEKGAYGVVEAVHEVIHHLLYEYLKELEKRN